MKRFLILMLFFLSLPLYSREFSWGVGNSIDISWHFSSEMSDRGGFYLFVKPSLEVEGISFKSVPYLSGKVTLYKNSGKIYESQLSPVFLPVGYIYVTPVDDEHMESADEIEIIIGPDNNIVKDSLEDIGSILDETYDIKLYGVKVTENISWNNYSITDAPGPFFPWDPHDDILMTSNTIVQITQDSYSRIGNDIELLRRRLGDLTQDEMNIFNLLKKHASDKEKFSYSGVLARVLGFYKMIDLLPYSTVEYSSVEEMWFWGRSFIDYISSSGMVIEWDSLFNKARNSVIRGEDPSLYLIGAEGVLQKNIADYYMNSLTAPVGELTCYVYFFKPIADEIGFPVQGWIDDISQGSTAPEILLYKFWSKAVEFFMRKVEDGESQWNEILNRYIDKGGEWIIKKLGGDQYSLYENNFKMWQTAVLAGDENVAENARNELVSILNSLWEEGK